MSLSNSLFYKIMKKNCNHKIQHKKNKSYYYNKSYFYCYKCNNIILIIDNKLYSTYKFSYGEDITEKIEFDPIEVVKTMIKRQEKQIKEINEKLVLNFNNEENNDYLNQFNINVFSESEKYNYSKITNNETEKNEKEKINKEKKIQSDLIFYFTPQKEKLNNKFTKLLFDEEILYKYSKQRKKVLIYIHKLCTKLKFNDNTFYLTLYLLDTYLSRIITDDITERELFLVVLGFFLISSKYIEDDIFEPDLQIFCDIEKNIPLNIEEIRESEVQCLTILNYNMFLYSAYDWINILLNNGILFEMEIREENELQNIYIYTQKLLTLITGKTYFCKYSSIQIACSIVRISREKFLNKNLEISEKLFKLLFGLYGVEFSDFEECYNIIKQDLSNININDYDSSINSNTNTNTNSKTNINKNMKSLETKFNSKNNILKEEKNITNKSISDRKNKYKIYLNSNKGKKYINTDFNIKLNNHSSNKKKKYKFKLYSSPCQLNFINNKNRNKSCNKNLEFKQNNSVGILKFNNTNKLSPNILTHNNSLHNSSFKSCVYIPKETNYKNHKKLMLSEKIKKNSNTYYINNAPKFLLKNNGSNTINNINYINNINTNNKIINLYSRNKEKRMNKNNSCGLNFNCCENFSEKNRNSNSKNKYDNKSNNYNPTKISFILKSCSHNKININNINTINNININNKIKNGKNNNFINIQNIMEINNAIKTFKKHKKLNSNNKEKYKTNLLLNIIQNNNIGDIDYNRKEVNKNFIPFERENKSYNKYTFNENDNISKNSNKKNSKIKIHLGKRKEIRIMNTNININLKHKLKNRKFTINFKDIIAQKTKKETLNNFKNYKEDKSLNKKNKYILSYYKNRKKNNDIYQDYKSNKSKNEYKFINNKKVDINNKRHDNNIKLQNNILLMKNLEVISSKFPKLKFSKKSIVSKK